MARRFIEATAEDTRAEMGEAMYALMAMDLVELAPTKVGVNVMSSYGLDRDRIRRGMDDFLRRYPSPVTFHVFARAAWRLNDYEKVKELFSHPELGWGEFAKPVWKTRMEYDQARSPIFGLPPDRQSRAGRARPGRRRHVGLCERHRPERPAAPGRRSRTRALDGGGQMR